MVTAVTGTPILKNIQSTTQCKNQLFTWRLLRLLRILQLHSLRVFSHLWCLAHSSQTRVCFPITAFIDGVHMIWPYPMWNSTKPSADSDHRKCLMWACLIREFKRSFTIRGQCCVLTCAGINQLIKYLSWVQVALLQEEGSKISLFSHSPTYGIAQVCLCARWWAGDEQVTHSGTHTSHLVAVRIQTHVHDSAAELSYLILSQFILFGCF